MMKKLKLPIIIIAVAIVVSVVCCFVMGIRHKPIVTEHEFNFSVTYRLDGETKTYEGVYKVKFGGYGNAEPLDRSYYGEYVGDEDESSRIHMVAQNDDNTLCIVTYFNDSYLMGDTEDYEYSPTVPDPYLAVFNRDGEEYDLESVPDAFDAEIISWDYPAPVDNIFAFDGFVPLYGNSLIAMLLVSFVALIACVIFVKKDSDVEYKNLDKLSTVLNCFITVAVVPFISVAMLMMPLVMSTDDFMYQVLLCIPALTMLSIAASVSLRRKGLSRWGFFVQLIFPVLFFLCLVVESVINSLF